MFTDQPNATSMNDISVPETAILLCTHFGETFLAAQLDSIESQSVSNWRVYVSDDRSTDATRDILDEYRRRWGDKRLSVRTGPGAGFRANFLSLACAADIHARYYAFADQDDVWDTDKLEIGLRWLQAEPDDSPRLYCARTRLIDCQNQVVGYSPLFRRPVSFRNALVQSVAGGNTMVFNNATRDLLVEAGADVDVQTHDWWAYLLTTGCGGRVHYDPRPTVGYRQHGANLVGSNVSIVGRIRRARRMLAGHFRDMNARNIAALRRMQHRMSIENAELLKQFETARNEIVLRRLISMRKVGVYCHTPIGNLGLIAATLLRKI
jgi:hypothetical protein